MARRLSAAHKAAISLALRRVKGATTGLDAYVPKPKAPKKPAAPKKPTRASAGSGKKTAVKKTAGKKPAPAKAPAKKTAAKKPATKAPARKNTLPAPDNSPMPKKKTAATNRPTPKAESPAQARKADAEFKANREARRDSTPFGSIRNSMAEAQLINGRKSDRDRDEDLADAIQRDSKLTGAEATAKRNAGTAAQLNAAKRRKAALREKGLADRRAVPDRAAAMEDSRKYGSAETQQFTDGTPGTYLERGDAPGMVGDGDKVRAVEDNEFFQGEMTINGKPYVEDDGMAYVEVVKNNNTVEVLRADLEGNVLNEEGKVVASSTKPKRRDSGTLIPNARELPTSNKPAPLKPGLVPEDRMENMARAGDKVKGTGTDNEFFKGTFNVASDPYLESDGNIYVEIERGNHSVESVRTDADGNIFDQDNNIVAVRVTEGGTKIKRSSSRGRGKSARRSDAPDPRVSGFNVDGLW